MSLMYEVASGIEPLYRESYKRRVRPPMITPTLDLPENLTVEEAQRAIDTASAIKSGTESIANGASKIVTGATEMAKGAKARVIGAFKSVTG